MKLNPPDTAPKDALILAAFGTDMYPAVWNELCWVWDIACAENLIQGGRKWYEIEIDEKEREEITGWLPMPTIDNEGNAA